MSKSKHSEQPILVLTTIASLEAGERIATILVEERLAACVNLIPGITSIYNWESTMQKESEVLAVIKTFKNIQKQVFNRIKQLHDYDIPEIIAIDVAQTDDAYLNWMSSGINQ